MFVKIVNKIRSKIQICVCSEKVVICKYKTIIPCRFTTTTELFTCEGHRISDD